MGSQDREEPLSGRALEVALALRDACAGNGGRPVSPRHCGGTARSDHSARLANLVRRGLATEAPKNPWGGGKVYALTEAGLRALPDAASARAGEPAEISSPDLRNPEPISL